MEMLGEVAKLPAIKLIMSVDSSKAGILFSEHQLDIFNFVTMRADTFEPTNDEREFATTNLFEEKNESQELGLAFIFKSMTTNNRNIVREIAKY